MTRKRFVKLLMAAGCSRNATNLAANLLVSEVRSGCCPKLKGQKISYQQALQYLFVIALLANNVKVAKALEPHLPLEPETRKTIREKLAERELS